MKENTFQIEIEGRPLQIKISDWAEQASSSCLVRYGDTEVLATCVMSEQEREDVDFFPLTVEYQERYYAAGKIYGSRFVRREARPTEEAILTSRMIDRSIRPRFPKDFKKEVQVIITCLSWDGENDPDILGLIASSIVLSTSNIPWKGPIGVIRMGKSASGGNKKWISNPTYKQREESELDLVLSAVEVNGKLLINMIELGAKEISESEILEATETAESELKKIIDFQKKIIEKNSKEKISAPTPSDPKLEKEIKDFLKNKLEDAVFIKDRLKASEEINKIREELVNFVEEEKTGYALAFLEKERERIIHENAIKNNKRPDGRKLDEIREISCQVGILSRTHGSGLFCRGLTKTLSILTLGSPRDHQLLEGMEIVGKKRFIHHYNFPPYSAGEVGRLMGPKRREIGHGCLVEKALLPLIPDSEQFPYTIRIVSESLSSNGSTSMASICSSSLALMDAGVPIERPVAGIALGLMKNESGEYKILTDIQGPEDSLGDMDLKVAGTSKGITSIQMDVKIDGIDIEILKEGLERAKKTRFEILDKMEKVISKPKAELSRWAPKIRTVQINPSKIGEVVGPRGSVINKMIEEYGTSIDIEDTGLIYITGEDETSVQKTIDQIKNITREPEIGETFQGEVKRIMDFGVFVEVLPGQTGLVHVSNLVPYKVKRIGDVVKIGDVIPVKVTSIDELGRINLSAIEAGFRPKEK